MDGPAPTITPTPQPQRGNDWQRIVLAFVIGVLAGAAVLLRHHARLQATPAEMLGYALGSGFVAMLTAGILQLSRVLWSKGITASIVAILLFGVGSITAISLICFISVVAFSA